MDNTDIVIVPGTLLPTHTFSAPPDMPGVF
jgi:hypothetical protein